MASLMAAAELPQEVLAILPAEPSAQLELAYRIIGFSFSQKVAQVEAEAQQLRENLIQKQSTIKTLERRLASMELDLQEVQAKHKAVVEDQHKLQAEKGALIETVKKLNREVSKLEAFKKNLMQHLNDDDEPGKLETSVAAIDISSDRLVSEVLSSASKPMPSHTSASYLARGAGAGMAPSTSGRAGLYNSSPPRPTFAVPTASSPKIDGKEFFRQARARLSYEQFSQFLQAIKELNAGRQTRDETLRRARDIFGPAHQDLFVLFESLLSRTITTF